MVTAFAPGKCILFGEHAVVYGEPAVAVSIDAGVEVTISESNKWILEGMPFEPSRHPHISHIINDIFQYRGNPLNIDIRSSLFSANWTWFIRRTFQFNGGKHCISSLNQMSH